MRIIISRIVALLLITLTSGSFAGSFHYNIDVMTQIFGDDKGAIDTVQMSWLYDEKITNILLQDEDMSPAKIQASLEAVAARAMKDLKKLHYFSQIKNHGKPVKILNVEGYKVELIDHKYLRLLIDLPLAQPIKVSGAKLSISVADPNGAALLSYDEVKRIVIDESVKGQCRVHLTQFETVEHGQAAQRVDVNCK